VGLSTDKAIRAMLLLPRLAARIKHIRIPEQLESFTLAPRHLSPLAYVLFDGPMPVNQPAVRPARPGARRARVVA
jgi:hypothetical protein